jgi:hypothetical protein
MSEPQFNAIDRLTSKKLTHPRNTSLVQMAVQAPSLENSVELSQPISVSKSESSVSLPASSPPLEISAGMLRIETSVNAAIQSICTQRKISRDTFVEAAWLVLDQNPSVMNDVIAVAQERYKKRKARGNAKRAESMEKYKDFE